MMVIAVAAAGCGVGAAGPGGGVGDDVACGVVVGVLTGGAATVIVPVMLGWNVLSQTNRYVPG